MPYMHGVVGSNPTRDTKKINNTIKYIAQLVECLSYTQKVLGSSPNILTAFIV